MSRATQLAGSLAVAIRDRGLSDESEGPFYVRASGIGDCARKLTYSGLYPNQRGAPDSYGMYQAEEGHWFEAGIKDYMEAAGYLIEDAQLELMALDDDGRPIVVGHIDGLIREIGGVIRTPQSLWECKAMSSYRFRKVSERGVKESDPGYYQQVQLYMTMLNDMGYMIDDCLFLALAKDPSAVNARGAAFLDPIYTEEIPWDPGYGRNLIVRAKRIRDTVDNQTLAKHERVPGKDWDCSERFCPYYAVCDPKNSIKRAQHG